MAHCISVLCITDYFLPGFLGGGPITTLANLRRQLNGSIRFSIFTRDHDLGVNVAYSGIKSNRWLETPDGPVYYASHTHFGLRGLISILKKGSFDIIYLNSFFSIFGSIVPIIGLGIIAPKLPVLLAPRGEFSPGALSIKKQKKWIFIKLVRFIGIYKNVFWHASTKLERDDILRVFPEVSDRIFIAADPVNAEIDVMEPYCHSFDHAKLNIAFVSRITPKKNLDGLIKILSTVSARVQLNIYGPVENDSYWKHCIDLIDVLPENIQVSMHGPVKPQLVRDIFLKHDLFAFPTHGENFGHVIFESLIAGTPVIVSDQTPWKADNNGAVTVIPLSDAAGWRDAIEKVATYTMDKREFIRNSSRKYAIDYLVDYGNRKDNLNIFVDVLNY